MLRKVFSMPTSMASLAADLQQHPPDLCDPLYADVCISIYIYIYIRIFIYWRGMQIDDKSRQGERKHWEAVKAIYLNSTHPEERQNALSAMAASKDAATQLETFEFALSSAVRGQDINSVLRATGASSTVAWDFFTSRIEALKAEFGGGQSFILSGLVKGVTAGFSTEADATMVAEFFAKHAESLPSAKRAISQVLEAITGKAAFHAENVEDVVTYFRGKVAAAAAAPGVVAPVVAAAAPAGCPWSNCPCKKRSGSCSCGPKCKCGSNSE